MIERERERKEFVGEFCIFWYKIQSYSPQKINIALYKYKMGAKNAEDLYV